MKKAIDICLIPPPHIIDDILAWNKEAVDSGMSPVTLDNVQRLPHLSLLMGIAAEKDLPAIIASVEELTSQYTPVAIQTTSIHTNWIHIEKSTQLMALHMALMEHVYPLLLKEQGVAELYGDAKNTEIDPGVYRWINDFALVGKEAFAPHITIWHETKQDMTYHNSFSCDTLAIAHLGNFNTIHSILWTNKP